MNKDKSDLKKDIIGTPNNELPKDFEEMIRLNELQPNQFTPQFDIYKDFQLREIIEKTNQIQQPTQQYTGQYTEQEKLVQSNQYEQLEQLNQMVQSLPFINDNIRANLKFGMEIYKQLNNFDRIYIHTIINEHSIESTKS